MQVVSPIKSLIICFVCGLWWPATSSSNYHSSSHDTKEDRNQAVLTTLVYYITYSVARGLIASNCLPVNPDLHERDAHVPLCAAGMPGMSLEP